MYKDIFYDEVDATLFKGRLNGSQREGMDIKIDVFDACRVDDIRWRAYMLATSYHETARSMRPVEEAGKGKGKPYGVKLKYDGTAYTYPDCIYYGRGDVQLTWYENYERMGKLLGIPLLERPDMALNLEMSARIMIEGMTLGCSNRGDFTGVSLDMFFNDVTDNPVGARRVVNGADKAHVIAGYYRKFLSALKMAMMVALLLIVGVGCKPCKTVAEQVEYSIDSSATQTASLRSKTTTHEVNYDTAAPLDSVTGERPVLSEVVTTTHSRYDSKVDDEATSTVVADKLVNESIHGKENMLTGSFNYKTFFLGLAAGVVIMLVLLWNLSTKNK